MKNRPEKENVLPPEPQILERIRNVRMKLEGTDREDHIRETQIWEERAKKALILINLQGHEGMKMVLERARQEIRQINWELVKEEEGEAIFAYDPNLLISKQLKRDDLVKMRRLWEWLMGLFGEAEADVKSITAEITIQENDDE